MKIIPETYLQVWGETIDVIMKSGSHTEQKCYKQNSDD